MGLLEGLVASRFSMFVSELEEGLNCVLDVGCRFGWAGHLLASIAGKPLKITGLDIYEPYLEKLAAMSKMYDLVKIDLETDPIPLPDESVDIAMAIEVLEHLSKAAGYRLVKEMERVTRRGGFVYLTTPNGFAQTHGRAAHLTHKSGWTIHELKRLGFEVRGYGFPLRRRAGGISRLVSNIDFAWTSLSRIIPSVSYGLEAWKKR
ncbi:MAG: class I SAM-dependent methyltransferase [Nitrososphaerota archaeon]